MADETKTETKAETKVETKPSNNTIEKALLHLETIAKEQEAEFAGKAGYNPFTWNKNKVEPLRNALLENPSEENIKKALALTKSPPVVGTQEIPVRLIPEEKLQPKVGSASDKKK